MGKFQTPIRSLPAFEKSEFADDWRELMRLYLVRRTRSFIKSYYTKTDETNGRKYLTFPDGTRSYFPDRLPKKVEYPFNVSDPNDQYIKLYADEVVQIINNLNLPRYGLGQDQYLNQKPLVKPSSAESIIMQNLGRAGARLKGFARTNLFKRLESSGYSFLLSISRHILRNYIFIYAIENKLPFPIGKQDAIILDDYLEDQDTDLTFSEEEKINLFLEGSAYYAQAQKVYELFHKEFRNRFDWIGSQLFSENLKEALINDSGDLIKILKIGRDWSATKDKQLNALYDLITKIHWKEKVLIFTQFADTARYIAEELKNRNVDKVEYVTGDDEDPTEYAYRFSPDSNDKRKEINEVNEIRVLITTDVLSEGQNLQDAHIILNYDLPWAIIRLIQRAGRVDRIG